MEHKNHLEIYVKWRKKTKKNPNADTIIDNGNFIKWVFCGTFFICKFFVMA